MEERSSIGRNIQASIEGNVLTLTIDLSQEIGPSKSGKNLLLASTNGNATLADGTRVGVNVFRAAR